jgi:hypothetical protein
MPKSRGLQGSLTQILQYCESFRPLADKIKQQKYSEADWAPLEELVDVARFKREGVILT